KAPPGEEGTVVALKILGFLPLIGTLIDLIGHLMGWRSTTVVVMTPLCKDCDEEGFPEGLHKLVSVEGNTFVLTGVSDGFAVALEKKREHLKNQMGIGNESA